MSNYIYLDYNATTPLEPRVLEEMMPYLTTNYANASSTHKFGLLINEAVKKARQQVANLIDVESNEIVFTSGATEGVNLAIKGVALAYQNRGNHIITLKTEHKAVLDTCKYLETIGFEVEYLSVQSDGLLDLEILKEAIRQDTILVSVMYANNEIGVIQPIKEIVEITHSVGAIFFTDATQAFGKIPISVYNLGIDLMTFSGHKIYAPKGIGGLFINKHTKIEAQNHGGGHENGFRSGTLNVPSIIGLGKACELAVMDMPKDLKHIEGLRNFLENELLKIDSTFINGNREKRLFNTTNIQFRGLNSDIMIKALDNICVSSSSACTSAIPEPSYVLKAIGLSDQYSYSSLRFSLGKFNNLAEIQEAISEINRVVANLKKKK
jgi:cysteine desulfurase